LADGVLLRPCTFRPTFHKHAGQACAGVQPHVIDPDRFHPVATYTWLVGRSRAQDTTRFAWRTEPYEFIGDRLAIDLLYGSPRERLAIEAGASIEEVASAWVAEEAEFVGRRVAYLLYDEPRPPRSTSPWLARSTR
jgi:uncharacterized protein YbbC (DUF1343 family)